MPTFEEKLANFRSSQQVESQPERSFEDKLSEFRASQTAQTPPPEETWVKKNLTALSPYVGMIPHAGPEAALRPEPGTQPWQDVHGERGFQDLSGPMKFLSQGAYLGAKGLMGGVDMLAGLPDQMINPEAYGTTRGGAATDALKGIGEMFTNLPAQADYTMAHLLNLVPGVNVDPAAPEKMFGLHDIMAWTKGEDPNEYYKKAVQQQYTSAGLDPVFAVMMGRGGAKVKNRLARGKQPTIAKQAAPGGSMLDEMSAFKAQADMPLQITDARPHGGWQPAPWMQEVKPKPPKQRQRVLISKTPQLSKPTPIKKGVEVAVSKPKPPSKSKKILGAAIATGGTGYLASEILSKDKDHNIAKAFAVPLIASTVAIGLGARAKVKVKSFAAGGKANARWAINKVIQAKNTIKTPEGKSIIADIPKADELKARYSGTAVEDLKFTGVTKRKAPWSHKIKGETLADALEGKKTDIAPEMVAGVRKVLDQVRQNVVDAGGSVGKLKDYFPRVWKEDVARIVRDDIRPIVKMLEDKTSVGSTVSDIGIKNMLKGKDIKTRKIIDAITSRGKTYSQAIAIMEREAHTQLFNEPGFVKARALDLPSWVFERNAHKVLPRYIAAMSQHAAVTKTWGVHGERLTKAFKQMRDTAPLEVESTRQLVDMWSGEYARQHRFSASGRKAVDAFTAFEFGTKIGLGTAAIPNLTQTFISALNLGALNTIKGGLKTLTKEGRSNIRKSGALNQVLHATLGQEPGGLLGKFSKVTGTTSGFMTVVKANQYIAAATFEQAAKSWHKAAKRNTAYGRFARDRLNDFGMDWKKPITEKKMLEQMYRFATDSQLQKNVLNDPVAFNKPHFRPLVLFKRFGYRQMVWQKENLMREFKRAYGESRAGGGTKLQATGKAVTQGGMRTVVPVLRLAAGGYFGGEFVVWAKDQLKSLLTGDHYERDDDHATLERFINNIAAVGSMGIVTDLASSKSENEFRRALGWIAEPVIWNDFEKAVLYGKPEQTFGSLPRWLMQESKKKAKISTGRVRKRRTRRTKRNR